MRWCIAAEPDDHAWAADVIAHLQSQLEGVLYDWRSGEYDANKMIDAATKCDVFVLRYHPEPGRSLDALDAVLDRGNPAMVYVVGGGDRAGDFCEDRPVRYATDMNDVLTMCGINIMF